MPALSPRALSFAALPPLSSRRTRLWLLLVSGVIGLLMTLHYTPGWNAPAQATLGLPTLTVLAIFLVALACEFMDSSLGMGFGTTLTPVLLLAGYEPLQIVPAVLLSELMAGFTAGLLHQRDGNVDFLRDARARKTTLLLGSLSGIGALLAVWVAVSISRFWLGVFITAIILAMGAIILLTRNRQIPYRAGGIVAIGAVAAFNKGLSGGGYGPLVTAGQVVSGLPAKHAVAVTSVAESLTCLIGVLGYLAMGQSIAWELAMPLALGALLSVPMATLTVSRASEASLRGVVGVVTLVLGVVALLKLL
ncbi:MAG: sulfite exporter TauE/SafE family protein [Pseudomonadota bacterium]|nr:sulfite exporter TauE/SafE family protein [Pseudomonadota bacterium]